MSFPQFFVTRPIFATVLSIVIVIGGGLAYFALPVSQYPEVAPPTIVVTAAYPGATPETIAETVATPLEQEINGVENMLYMESQSTADGAMQLTVTFALGTDLDQAQVLVQNRVAIAQPRLPEEVRRIGVTTNKQSPDLMLVVHLLSPDDSLDQLYISNYAFLQIRDVLARTDGVGSVQIFGAREYSMRVWLDADRMQSLNLTTIDVVNALRSQNIQVAAGTIGQQPLEEARDFQFTVSTQGRLREADEFADIILKSGDNGRLVRVSDVARVELGARDYSVNSYMDDDVAVAMVIFQRPGSNAVETTARVLNVMEDLSRSFPEGLAHEVIYNPTQFVEDSISEVFVTLLQAGALVVLTVFVFLQSWRTTLIPLAAIPVALVGTFGVMLAIGFSLNNLSLFGLVLAIGIVVDDAIVVVENVERLIAEGVAPEPATRQAMDEVGGALIATSLVLIAVFVPTAFISGISGQFYRQFAITISVSTAISTFVSLTLSPALCNLLLKPKDAKQGILERLQGWTLGWFFRGFNWVFERLEAIYANVVGGVLKIRWLIMIVYVGLLGLTWYGFQLVPGGFIPQQDQGYLIVSIQLPDGASLTRTDEVTRKVSKLAREVDGIVHSVAFAGFSGATRVNQSNAAAVFTTLAPFSERAGTGRTAEAILADLRPKLASIPEAFIVTLQPPPVRGIGTGGGFKMQIQDRGNVGLARLQEAANTMMGKANENAGLVQVYTTIRTATPQFYADIDRTKARMLDVPLGNVFDTLQVYLGSIYVNDFNYLGRVYRVTAQAEPEFRNDLDDIYRLRTLSNRGAVVPLGSLVDVEKRTGPDRVVRYNLYPAADLSGDTAPGYSTGQALSSLEKLAAEELPDGVSFEWTDLAYQQKLAGNTALYIFPLCVLFVFLALSAQYESWTLPLAVILIVPMCLLFGIFGVFLRGMDNNILTQIGFVVLVGLACKNAILIVEFAKQQEEEEGRDRFEAAIEACRLRLRPILMTAFSFILGVIPLLIATGAGAEMRQALGTAVFAGMLGVTIFGLFLTPVFYVILRREQPELATAGEANTTTEVSSESPSNTTTEATTRTEPEPEPTASEIPTTSETQQEQASEKSDGEGDSSRDEESDDRPQTE